MTENFFLSESSKKNNDFCLPIENCPERRQTKQLPSPTSCLNERELQLLDKQIRLKNTFLLNLALSGKREENDVQKDIFQALAGKRVSISTIYGEVTGIVQLAGKDFVLLQSLNSKVTVRYESIIMSCSNQLLEDTIENQELISPTPCDHRALVLEFGETVAASPELFSIFFGLRLNQYVNGWLEKEIEVLGKKHTTGQLCEVRNEEIVLCVGVDKIDIPFEDISAIKLLSK